MSSKKFNHSSAIKDLKVYFESCGMTLPTADIRAFLLHLLEDDKEYWTDEFAHKSFDDTAPRSRMFDAFAKRFLDMDWPINGDSSVYQDQFWSTLRDVGEKRKWKLNIRQIA